MIEFDPKRVRPVKELLQRYSDRRDSAFELTHRALAQSYKVLHAQLDVARLIGAVGLLFTGDSDLVRLQSRVVVASEAERSPVAMGLAEAQRLFVATQAPRLPTRSLLLDHAERVLAVKPMRHKNSGYIDLDADHLVLVGARELFRRCVMALVQPYVDRNEAIKEQGYLTYAQAITTDIALWMKPEIIAQAIDGRRCWPEWDAAVDRNTP